MKKSHKNNIFRALLGVFLICAGAAFAQDLPKTGLSWKDVKFTSVFRDQPLKSVLETILRENGNIAVIDRGVVGEVTHEFEDVPLRNVFAKLVLEYKLEYLYNPDTNIVTVLPQGAILRVPQLFTPKYVTLTEIESALKRFGVTGGEILYDYPTSTMAIRGTADEVNYIQTVALHVDNVAQARLEAEAKRRALARDAQLKDLETSTYAQRLEDQKVETEVIRLAYASVTGTTTTFQGEDVTLPGIDETLKTLLAGQGDNILIGAEATAADTTTTAAAEPAAAGVGAAAPAPVVTRVSVDPRTNSIIVRGPRRVIDDIKEIVDSLDQPVPLVDIEVLIVEASAGLTRALGVQWGGGRSSNSGKVGAGFATGSNAGTTVKTLAGGVTANPITLLPLETTGQNIVASFIYNGSRSFIQEQFAALSDVIKAQVVSSPHVVTLDNVAAQVTSNTALFIPTITGDGTQAQLQSVDAGINLDITPSVFTPGDKQARDLVDPEKQKLLRMTINASSSSLDATNVANPQTATREIQTQVVMRDGATFVLGGLFTTTRTEGQDGVPGLQDIPVLGWLFRNRTSVDSRTETVFFITPGVVEQSELLSAEIGYEPRVPRGHREKLGHDAESYLGRQRLRLGGEVETLHRTIGLVNPSASIQEDE